MKTVLKIHADAVIGPQRKPFRTRDVRCKLAANWPRPAPVRKDAPDCSVTDDAKDDFILHLLWCSLLTHDS
jgi:hypothetical protein